MITLSFITKEQALEIIGRINYKEVIKKALRKQRFLDCYGVAALNISTGAIETFSLKYGDILPQDYIELIYIDKSINQCNILKYLSEREKTEYLDIYQKTMSLEEYFDYIFLDTSDIITNEIFEETKNIYYQKLIKRINYKYMN